MDGSHLFCFPFQNAPGSTPFSYSAQRTSSPARVGRPRLDRPDKQRRERQQNKKNEQSPAVQRLQPLPEVNVSEQISNTSSPESNNSDQEAGEASACSSPAAASTGESGPEVPSETILTFRRDGEGWGEAILPRIVFQSRALETRQGLQHRVRNRCSRPAPWQVTSRQHSLQQYVLSDFCLKC